MRIPEADPAALSNFTRRGLLGACFALGIGAVALGVTRTSRRSSVKVGVLHSLTGTMAISEQPVVDATLLAIDEINEAGGVLGALIEPILRDGRSDPNEFARVAEHLIREEEVATVFGCWTSASRKTVKPIFERYDHLLFYPVQYEGLEQSPNIVYTGAAPNQQLNPAVAWALEHLGKRIFLIGSDYIYPRIANRLMGMQITALGGEVTGEHYLKLGTRDVAPVIEAILAAKPDVILNTINGDTNLAFFQALRAAGVDSQKVPTISFSISEPELAHFEPGMLEGDYASWTYFQSIDSAANHSFVDRFQHRYGAKRTTSEPLEAAYTGVKLWARAVERSGTAEPRSIRDALLGLSADAPGGPVYVDPDNHHLWRTPRIGRIDANGQFNVVWVAGRPRRPIPYPVWRTRDQWEYMLDEMQRGWNGQWMAP